MSQENRGFFAKTFLLLMIFCGLVWIWTVAFIVAWPWEKTSVWKPEFRVAAVCDQDEPCGFAYGQLAEAKAKGLYKTLNLDGDAGDVMEKDGWLQWKKVNGLIEAKASSWYFQTTIRYKLEGDTPVLVEYQDVSAKAFYYGIAAGLFSLIGLYLRKFRK
ncbi:MAG: hypothetical protein ACM3X0_07870 [Bacteroidota bacterium]